MFPGRSPRRRETIAESGRSRGIRSVAAATSARARRGKDRQLRYCRLWVCPRLSVVHQERSSRLWVPAESRSCLDSKVPRIVGCRPNDGSASTSCPCIRQASAQFRAESQINPHQRLTRKPICFGPLPAFPLGNIARSREEHRPTNPYLEPTYGPAETGIFLLLTVSGSRFSRVGSVGNDRVFPIGNGGGETETTRPRSRSGSAASCADSGTWAGSAVSSPSRAACGAARAPCGRSPAARRPR
jgi:hypothetical protein